MFGDGERHLNHRVWDPGQLVSLGFAETSDKSLTLCAPHCPPSITPLSRLATLGSLITSLLCAISPPRLPFPFDEQLTRRGKCSVHSGCSIQRDGAALSRCGCPGISLSQNIRVSAQICISVTVQQAGVEGLHILVQMQMCRSGIAH